MAVVGPVNGRIVFTAESDLRFERAVYSMNPDGTDRIALAADAHDPSVSRNGGRIAFSNPNGGIETMDADGGNRRVVFQIPGVYAHSPSISADGSRIAFESSHGAPDREIFVMDADGGNVSQVTASPDVDTDPAFSPDGNQIVFSSDRTGHGDIYVANIDGSGVTRLTDHGAADRQPVFSPDGLRIAFTSPRDGQDEIYTMDTDGTSVVRVTDNPGFDGEAAYSPDGQKIAFFSERNQDGFGIFVMDADGSGELRSLVDSSSRDRDAQPAWGAAPPPAYCQGEEATIVGSSGDDTLTGTAGPDVIVGRGGDDTIDGLGGDDVICGGPGADTMSGGDGVDTVSYDDHLDSVLADLSGSAGDDGNELDGPAGARDTISADVENLTGSMGNDTLTGGTKKGETLHGGPGLDVLSTGESLGDPSVPTDAVDTLYGGRDNDIMNAHGGTNRLLGQSGNDQMVGGPGPDTLIGGIDVNYLFGEGGDDHLRGGPAHDLMVGALGNDRLLGGLGDDELHGQSGDDRLYGGPGADYVGGGAEDDVLSGGTGPDILEGHGGIDTVSYALRQQGVVVDLSGGSGDDGNDQDGPEGFRDTVIEIENLTGTMFADRLTGSLTAGETIVGLGGNDVLNAGPSDNNLLAPADRLVGGLGDDTLTATGGNNRLYGGAGVDSLTGGAGPDTLVGGADYGYLNGSQGDDVVVGGPDGNTMWGGDGDDSMAGGTGPDYIEGEAGNDRLRGGSGNDTLFGQHGDDRLDGGDRDDLLYGGRGGDSLSGGSGVDRVGYDVNEQSHRSIGVTVTVGAGPSRNDGSVEDGPIGARDNVSFNVEEILGTEFDDTLTGNHLANLLLGGLGSDSLFGLGGDDRLDAADGTTDTVIDCGDGNDSAAFDDGLDPAPVSCETTPDT